jgi:hypothetical protein
MDAIELCYLRAYKQSIPGDDGPIVKHLKHAGAIMHSKTNTSEFGYSWGWSRPPRLSADWRRSRTGSMTRTVRGVTLRLRNSKPSDKTACIRIRARTQVERALEGAR